MIIGLDLTVIQTPHRMRGIGATAINFINHIPASVKAKDTFVFYLYKDDQQDALDTLNLDAISYEVRTISEPKRFELKLPGKLQRLNSIINRFQSLWVTWLGDNRKADFSGIDTYLQFDQMQPLPNIKNVPKTVILYDLIPFIMEADYLWGYRTARHYGDSRKSSVRKALLRRQYITQLKVLCNKADRLVAISNHTKNDFVKYVGAPPAKITVVHLGIDQENIHDEAPIKLNQYIRNSWGYFKKSVDLTNKPFLLFVGGADSRRKLEHLIAAYHNLKAQGHDIRLVLAGDTMKGPKAIPTISIQKAFLASSYTEDTVFLGFVTDVEREWLYKNAVAFVYPSVYEGFGLPVLEAMAKGCPVITYKNSSIKEIAGDAALFAESSLDIYQSVLRLLADSTLRKTLSEKGEANAAKYLWSTTVKNVFAVIK